MTTMTTPTLSALDIRSSPLAFNIHSPSTIRASPPTPIVTHPSKEPIFTLTPPTRTNPNVLTFTFTAPSTLLIRRSGRTSPPTHPVLNPKLEFSHSVGGIYSPRYNSAVFSQDRQGRFSKMVGVPALRLNGDGTRNCEDMKGWEGEMDVRFYAWKGEKMVGAWFVGEYIYWEGQGTRFVPDF